MKFRTVMTVLLINVLILTQGLPVALAQARGHAPRPPPDFSGTTGSSFSPQGDCGSETEVDTAIGCIPTDFGGLFTKFFSLGIGIAGGIAFLLILFGGFQILTSAGNPEQLAAGKELVTSAITGLLMIIFSVFLLRVIGVDILGIPDFL